MLFLMMLVLLMLGQHAVFAAVCDTTDIYQIHHDISVDWIFTFLNTGKGCRKQSAIRIQSEERFSYDLHIPQCCANTGDYHKLIVYRIKNTDRCRPHAFCPYVNGQLKTYYCGYGFYNNKIDSITKDDCLPCPAGKYCIGGVKDCEPGYFCPENGLPKEPWPGYYAPNAGMTEPVKCPVGTYQNHIQHIKWNWRGISQCENCPEYMFCDVTGLIQPAGYCDEGWYCGENEVSARPAGQQCQPGEYCSYGKKFTCEEGTYQPYEGMNECFDCPEGQYCAGTGLSAPSGDCSAGWFCETREIALQPSGKTCPAGYMCPDGKKTPCGKGYYQPNTGQITCIPCPVGKYCDSIGLTNPTGDCNQGCCLETAQITKSSCPPTSPTPCNQGWYEENSVCTPCPEGMYCAISGLSSPSGTCEPGWYCETSEITPTPLGKFCPAGYKCPTGVKIACSSWVRDTDPYLGQEQFLYQPDRGQVECVVCPDRYSCTGSAVATTGRVCDPEYWCHSGLLLECQAEHFCNGGEMLPCRNGFTTSETGQHSCVRCGEGSLCEEGKVLTCPQNMVCFNGYAEYCELGYLCSSVGGTNMKSPCAPGTERYDVDSMECESCRYFRYCRSATSYECFRYAETFGCDGGADIAVWKLAAPGQLYRFVSERYDTNRGYRLDNCSPGTYQDRSARFYCYMCPGGQYCETEGLTSPTGSCSPGYYCFKGSVSPTWFECPVGHYCTANSGNPKQCVAGTFQPYTTQQACIPCTPGYFCNEIELISPTEICPAGSKCPEGTINPVPCVPHTHQYETGQANCVCDDGYYCQNEDENPTICPVGHFCLNNIKTPCPAGRYQSNQGSSGCTDCAVGMYQSNPGSVSCVPCAAGTFQVNTGSVVCDNCPAGWYQPNESSVNCVQCEAGTYQGNEGSSLCDPCEAGTYQPVKESLSCLQCAAGKYQPNAGSTDCLQCAAGTYQDNVGSLDCVPCPAGAYQPSVESSSCLLCAAGTYQSTQGSSSCLQCDAGTFQVGEGAASCDQCIAGTFQPDVGKTSCIQCPVGKFQPNPGMAGCSFCDAGTFQNTEGSTSCSQCEPGTYQPSTGSTSCTPCASGSYQSNTGMESCTSCSVGTYQDSTGMTECIPCDVGTYRDSEGGSVCTQCSPGTYQPLQGKSYCSQCNVGMFQTNSGSTGCNTCPSGTFGPVSGLAECWLCTANYYCQGTGLTSVTDICWIGHECPEGTSVPIPCQSGFYQPDIGSPSCKICPENFYCNKTEAEVEEQSGADKATHGVVIPKSCPYFVYCAPGSVAMVCDTDVYAEGDLNITISCKPSCREKMTPHGDLKFKAACNNCGTMIPSYEWSMRQCTSRDINKCRHCVRYVTYLPEYTANYMLYNHKETSHDHTDWIYFSIVVRVTLQNGTEGMTHFIYEYLQFTDVQCQILPVTGVALVTDFSISCSDPYLPDNMDYVCSMFYAYSSTGDTILYKTNSTCDKTGVILRQGDKNKGYRQHLKVVGKNVDHVLWDVPLLLLVDMPPMTTESIGGFIETVGGAITNASDDKEVVESLTKLQGLTYVLNEAVDVVNTTESEGESGNGGEEGGGSENGAGGEEGGDNGEVEEMKDENNTALLEQKRQENIKIRDTIVETISQINTTSVEVMATVASTLNQVTMKKDELSPETKEKTFEMFNTYTEQFKEMESTTAVDEEVTDAAKTLLFGVASIIDIVTDDIQLEEPEEEIIEDTSDTAAVTPAKVITTTPAPKTKKEKEEIKKQVKEKTEKLLKRVEDITDVVLTRQEVDSEPTTVETPIMSISVAKMSPEKLVGKPIKTETSGDDTETSLTLPEDLQLSDTGGSIGTEFVYMKKNPYVWADNSKTIQPPIVSIKLKDSENKILNISNLSSPVKVNLASKGGVLVGMVPILLRLLKNNGTITLAPSQRRPCAATFELTVQKGKAVAFTLTLPENFTSALLSVGLQSKFNVFQIIASGFRYPEDTNIIREFYGKLSKNDEVKFDNTSHYCETCSENCCNTTVECESIYKHCVYYCNKIVNHMLTAGCWEKPSVDVYCQDCQSQCCDKNCTGTLENCVIFCNISMEENLTTECITYADSVAELYTDLTQDVAGFCDSCKDKCCKETENCMGIYSNCLYFCENMLTNITTSCKNVSTSVETIYLFPRSHVTDVKDSHQIYFGISVDPTDKRVINDLINLDPRCLGNVSLETCLIDLTLTFPLKLSTMKCEYWDEANQEWSTKGLEVSKESRGNVLQCVSNHLTSFSKSVLVAPSFIDPLDVKLFLTLFENPVVVTVVVVIWMIYFFLVHWARQQDKLDVEQVGVIYCADNVATHTYTYLVCIVTGWWNQAGTTANVYIYLKGTVESSPRKCLKTPVRKCFQTGYEDWFLLTTEHSLGDISSVTLWHDNTGSSPHWFVNQIFVKDMQKDKSWTFIYNDWLAADRGNLLMTTTTLIPVTEEEIKFKKKYNFVIKSTQDLRDGHIWLSIFSKPASSSFTRVQRLTCCLTLLLTTMLTNIMFYGIPTDNPEDQVAAGGFKMSLSQIIIGIESSLIMFPVNMLIVQLFLKVKPRQQEHDYSEPKPVEYFLEVLFGSKWQEIMAEINKNLLELTNTKDTESMKVFTRVPRPSKDLILDTVASELSKRNEGKVFPWWFVYIAWVISILTCIICSYFVMLYGLKYGYTRSVEWLVSFLTGFFQSVFIQQPVKVLGLAVVLTLIFKKTPKFDEHAPEKEPDKDEEYLHSVSITPPESHQLVMEPLPKRLLAKIRQRLQIEWLMDITIRDMIFHALYLTVILVMVHGHRNINLTFQNTQTVRSIFVTPTHGFHLEEVSGRDDLYTYLQETVVPAMSDITSNHEEATIGSNHYLVGTYRLRQLRMKQDNCKPVIYNLPYSCKEPYWIGGEDTRNYNQSWVHPLPDDAEILEGGPWVCRSAWDLQTLPYPGTQATYSGGGYVVNFPVNVTDHPEVISSLISSEWIDGFTRAVFLEFTLYNPNVDLFTVVVYLFEFTTVGHIFPMHNEFTSRLYHYSSDTDILIACCEVLFLIFNIVFIHVEVKKLRRKGKSEYFTDFWSFIEIIQIALAIVLFGMFIKRIHSVNNAIEEFETSKGQYFVNFYSAMFWDFVFGYISASLIGLVTMKSVKHLRFNQRTKIISTTFGVIKSVFLGYVFMFALTTVAFAHISFLMFGSDMEDYQTFGDCWINVIIILMGEGDYVGVQNSYRFMGPLFIVTVIMICQYGLMVMMTTILNIGRLEAKYKLMKKKNKFELLNYIGSKVKLILNIK